MKITEKDQATPQTSELDDNTRVKPIGQQMRCPCRARTELLQLGKTFACSGGPGCRFSSDHKIGFPICEETPVLIPFGLEDTVCEESRYAGTMTRQYIPRKRNRLLHAIVTQSLGPSPVTENNCTAFIDAVLGLAPAPRVLVIGAGAPGAGTEELWAHPRIIKAGIDIYPSPSVQFVADAHYLPFADASFDGVWIQAVLEHVLDPVQVVREIHRVLRDDGVVYAETPFMQQVHEGAYDFTRFTVTGHRYLFKRFACMTLGPNKGPGMVLAWSVKYLILAVVRHAKIATAFSLPAFYFGRIIDRWLPVRDIWNGASGVYFMGRKVRGFCATAQEVLEQYGGRG